MSMCWHLSLQTPPLANCPADVKVVSVQGNFGSVANFGNAVCSDSEDPAGSIIASCDRQTDSFFQGLGITVVTCTCTDSAGDSNSCVFNVNVLAFVPPNTPPVANCPADVNVVSVQGNFGSVANFGNAVCSDSEDPAGSIIATCDHQTGSFFQGLGITIVTCTCTDSAGDSNSCVFNVNVLAFVPTNIPPVATCPADVTVVSVQGNNGSVANFDNATCSDSESSPGSVIATCDRQTGSFFQGLGITAVTCTCTDSAGDSNSCVFNVNVLAFVPPNTPPVATCPADVTVFSVQGDFGGFVEFNNAVCSDSEDPAGSIIPSCDRQTGSFFQGLGITVVTCTCTDSAGDSNSCVFNVNVLAFVPPNTPPLANCPADVKVVSVQGNFGSVANFGNAVCSDSEDPAGSIIASCDLRLIVSKDSELLQSPVLVQTRQETPIPVFLMSMCWHLSGDFGGFVEFNNAVCSDSENPAGSIIPSCDRQTGSFFQGLGITVVTCTCTDSAGDSNSCVFNVNVLAFVPPNTPPVANCPADVNVVSVQGNFGSVANFGNAVCSDSEDPAGSIIATCDHQTDSAGDSNSCVFNVNVLAFVREGDFGSVANFGNAVCSDSEDSAGSIIPSCDRQTGSFFQGLGITAVTCTCTDSAGDSNSCVFNVNVLAFVPPNTPPLANCPADVKVVSVQGNFGSVANFGNAVCSDSEDPAGSIIPSCDRQTGSFFQGLGITVVTCTCTDSAGDSNSCVFMSMCWHLSTGSFFQGLGITIVTCTCTDSAGDSNSCVFNVNVLAFVPTNIPPVATCPADVTVVSVQGNNGSVANFDNATCSDSESSAGSVIATCDRQTGSFFQGLGITVVTCTCTDSTGASNSCVFNVNFKVRGPSYLPEMETGASPARPMA
ncbi:hypothetical protein BSL78_02300 [Apostichopus japonicus]|uniref:HYR domain-containing protein n=1 Tax=Stichopus japonicus TaxID=307972 RepID=A0A2G8LKF0_STIJA|nr:hypothetical protein BSL78_02300 [Apostichopus japonicus]